MTATRAMLAGTFAGALVLVLALRVGVGTGVEPGQAPLRLFCGAAMRPAVQPIVEAFEQRHGQAVQVHYGPSNVLLSQLETGPERVDVFLPGDAWYVEQAQRGGLVEPSETVAGFRPVIAVRAGNPHGIRHIADLTRPGVRLGVADERSTALGRIMPALLTRSGLSADALTPNVRFTAATAPELGMNLGLGHIDASIVWAVVAHQHEGVETIEIDAVHNVIAPLAIAPVRREPEHPAAGALIQFFQQPEARRILRQHRFVVPQAGEPLDFQADGEEIVE